MERVKLGEFTWTDLQATDPDGQTAFYEALFGWTHEDMPTGENTPDYRMFSKDGAVVAACNTMSPDMKAAGMPSFWAVYVATPDAAASAAKAEELGGKVIMPLMDVLDSGKMAAIQDPTGGQIFIWEKVRFAGAATFMAEGTMGWADLSTRDPEGAVKFYGDWLGWTFNKMESEDMPYWQASIDDVGEGGIMPMPDMIPAEVPAFWLVYFMTDDIKASVDKAVSLGATVSAPIMEVPGMLSFAVLADPQGATFALMTPLM
jgi:uncharacterized protein